MSDTDEARAYLAKARMAADAAERLVDLNDSQGMMRLTMMFLRVAEVSSQIAQTERMGQMARDTKATQASMAEMIDKLPGLRDGDL